MDAFAQFARMLAEIKRPTPELLSAWLRHRAIGGGAQVFSADARTLIASVAIVLNVQTFVIATKAVRMPYQNGKIFFGGVLYVQLGTGTTGFQLSVQRNFTSENVAVLVMPSLTVTPSAVVAVPFLATDAIPDSRDCDYSVFVTMAAATSNASVAVGSSIGAIALSG